MKNRIFFTVFCVLIVEIFSQTDKIKLTDIQSLNFTLGRYTTYRRTSPISQLQCTGGNAGCTQQPRFAFCNNRAIVGISVTWECFAELPSNTKFGTLKVSCEGYNSSSDPYVLVGSCALLYTLDSSTTDSSLTVGTILGIVGFVILVVLIIIGFALISKYCSRATSVLPNRGGDRFYSGSRPFGFNNNHHHHHGGGNFDHSSGGGDMSSGFASSETR